jgi:hypothetical protein
MISAKRGPVQPARLASSLLRAHVRANDAGQFGSREAVVLKSSCASSWLVGV